MPLLVVVLVPPAPYTPPTSTPHPSRVVPLADCPLSPPAGLTVSIRERQRTSEYRTSAMNAYWRAGSLTATSDLPSQGRNWPGCGQLPSAIQGPERSFDASDALCDMFSSHPSTRQCRTTPGHVSACRVPAARAMKRNRATARSRPQNGNRSPWLCSSYL